MSLRSDMHFCVPGLDFFVFINRVVSFSKLYDCTSSSLSVLFPQTDIDIEPYISVMVTSCKSPVVTGRTVVIDVTVPETLTISLHLVY